MRRLLCLAAFVMLLVVAFPVSAETGAANAGYYATVSSDGSCQVSLTATLHLEQPADDLTFPVPDSATSITLNGSRIRASKSGQFRYVDLSGTVGQMVGDVSVTIQYTLADVIVQTDSGDLQLELPILCGFSYPVKAMEFSVTLPGEISGRPTFSSGYHQADIEKTMSFSVSGATVAGSFLSELKDHETLTMTMGVTEEMFPQPIVDVRNTDVCAVAMGICATLALVYWLLCLRNAPAKTRQEPTPPEGYSAGQLGCILNTRGLDLTATVFSWAQLGYLQIQLAPRDKVLLHKRMDMGNERSEAERRWFRKLFARRSTVDATGSFYTELCLEAAKKPAGVQPLLHRHSGSPMIFRGLMSGVGLFGGIFVGIGLGGGLLEGVVVVLTALLGAVGGWTVQGWAYGLWLRNKEPLYTGVAVSILWLLLGLAAGVFLTALVTVLGLLLAGLFLAWGGRRTLQGRQTLSQALGLRRYFRSVPKDQLQRIQEANPDYFFTLAPYALALGVSDTFAKRFGKTRLFGCPYLIAGEKDRLSATEWSLMLRHTASLMDAGSRWRAIEKITTMIRTLFK